MIGNRARGAALVAIAVAALTAAAVPARAGVALKAPPGAVTPAASVVATVTPRAAWEKLVDEPRYQFAVAFDGAPVLLAASSAAVAKIDGLAARPRPACSVLRVTVRANRGGGTWTRDSLTKSLKVCGPPALDSAAIAAAERDSFPVLAVVADGWAFKRDSLALLAEWDSSLAPQRTAAESLAVSARFELAATGPDSLALDAAAALPVGYARQACLIARNRYTRRAEVFGDDATRAACAQVRARADSLGVP